METQNFLKSKNFKTLMPFVVVLGSINLFKLGYAFGQWLENVLN